MPIDPEIALSTRGVGPLVNPYQVAGQIEAVRGQRESNAALREERTASAEQRRLQTEALQRKAEAEALGGQAVDELFATYQPGQPMPVKPISVMYRTYGAERTSAIVKGLSDMANADLTTADGLRNSMKVRLAAIVNLPEDRQEAAFNAAVQDYVARGAIKPEEAPVYSKETVAKYANALLSPDKRYDVEHPKPLTIGAGQTLLDPVTKQPIYTAPKEVTKPASVQEFEYAKTQGYKGTYEQYQNEDANRRRPVVNVNPGAVNDVKDTVAGMMDGSLPPQLPGRASKEYVAILGEAKRQGYNLAAAVTDWNATQRHIATLNNAQQTRLNQSIDALPEMLDSVDALASKWKAGKFPLLNKASLALAKGGAYGRDAASIANQLDAQIADVTADLGNVYMGGNSPTDHALGLAGKSLSGDWDEKVLHDMVKLARSNVQIRRNSILNSRVAGASENNPYDPRTAPQRQQPGAVPPSVSDALKGQKDGRYTLSDGTVWIVQGGQIKAGG